MHRKIVEPMTVLFARQELTIPEVGAYAEQYGVALMAEAEKHGLQITGPWVFISYNLPKNGRDRYVVDFCLPVREANGVTGPFSIKSLGRFPCAYATYTGKLRQIFTKAYQPLVQAIVSAGGQFTGESREVYHSWIGPGSPENCIEIQFGVRP